jgi:NADPH2:quinone reductase
MNSHPTMQAALLEAHAAPFRLATIARPLAGAGEVLVRVAGSGVNPLDLKIREGVAEHARQKLPAILGIDLAGTVVATGRGVTRFRPGDEVFGMTGGVGGHQGSLAQYAAVDAGLLALKPANLSMREASVVPLVFITAWEGLVDRMAVRAGQVVLVLGGAGASDRWRSRSPEPAVPPCSPPDLPPAKRRSSVWAPVSSIDRSPWRRS